MSIADRDCNCITFSVAHNGHCYCTLNWDFGDGTSLDTSACFTPITHCYTGPGSYVVSAYIACAGGDCSTNLTISVPPAPSTVGEHEQQNIKEGEATVFPNPFSNNALVKVSGNNQISAYRLYDMHGNIVKEKDKLSGYLLKISKDALTAGVYFLELEREKGMISRQKIIVL